MSLFGDDFEDGFVARFVYFGFGKDIATNLNLDV